MTRALRALQLSMLLCCLAACGDDQRFVGVGDGLDGAVGLDASDDSSGHGGFLPDGAPIPDGSGFLPDGAPIPDGGLEDGGEEHEIDPTEACEVAEMFNEHAEQVDTATPAGFALSIGETGFGLTYQSKPDSYALFTMQIDSAGEFGKPTRLPNETSSVIRDVSLLWSPGGWRMAWIDNSQLSAEVQVSSLTDSLRRPAGSMPTTLTKNALFESSPAFADIAGVPMLAWVASAEDDKQMRVTSKRLDASSELVDLVDKNAGFEPLSIALARMGEANAALAWVDKGDNRGIWLQKVDSSGKPSGAPTRMSDKTVSGSSVDLATRDSEGGAALYSIAIGGTNQEIRFRRLDATGAFTGQDVKIIGSPLQGTAASLARLGGGYVVAYRALPGGVITEPGLRMTFISKEGRTRRDPQGRLVSYPIADSDGTGGRVTVRVSNDGQILIAFLDGTGKLRLVRQRLDCQ